MNVRGGDAGLSTKKSTEEAMRSKKETWILAASGELGDMVCWEPRFEVIREVQSIVSSLEELGEEDVDWDALIGKFDYFKGLRNIDFPPLYKETDFEDAFPKDFSCLTFDPPPENDRPGMSFYGLEVCIRRERASAVLREFRAFLRHLKQVPQLKAAGLVE
jgi:hypothetical protein